MEFPVHIQHSLERIPEDVQVVFHAMNKSGSQAVSDLFFTTFSLANRAAEFHSHFRMPLSQSEFTRYVDDAKGGGFFIDHYMYGALKPKANRIFFTQFRHPLARILSIYNWLKNRFTGEGSFPSLTEFVVQTKGVGHSIVIQLGCNWANVGTKEWHATVSKLTSEELYERSLQALEREIYAVGIAEYFEESIFLYSDLVGLQTVPHWVRDQRNEDRLLSCDISSAELSVIEDVLRYDYLLYEFALNKFWRQFLELKNNADLILYREACLHEYRDRIFLNIPRSKIP